MVIAKSSSSHECKIKGARLSKDRRNFEDFPRVVEDEIPAIRKRKRLVPYRYVFSKKKAATLIVNTWFDHSAVSNYVSKPSVPTSVKQVKKRVVICDGAQTYTAQCLGVVEIPHRRPKYVRYGIGMVAAMRSGEIVFAKERKSVCVKRLNHVVGHKVTECRNYERTYEWKEENEIAARLEMCDFGPLHEENVNQMFGYVTRIGEKFSEVLDQMGLFARNGSDAFSSINRIIPKIEESISGVEDKVEKLFQIPLDPIKDVMSNINSHKVGLLSNLYALSSCNTLSGVIANLTISLSLMGIEQKVINLIMQKFSSMGDERTTEQISKKLIGVGVILASIFGKQMSPESVLKQMSGLMTNYGRQSDSVNKLLEDIEDMAEEFGFGFSKRTAFIAELKQDLGSIMEEIEQNEIQLLNNGSVFCGNKKYEAFRRLQAKLTEIRINLSTIKNKAFMSTSMSAEILNLTRQLDKQARIITEIRGTNGSRVTPVGVVLQGISGMGKSTLTSELLSRTKKRLYEKFVEQPVIYSDFEDSRVWTVWNQQVRDQYDQGYNGDQIHVVDDAFTDKQNKDHAQFLTFISNNCVGTVQAGLEQKGRPYNAKIVLVSCNHFPQNSVAINNLDALARRFGLFVHCVPSGTPKSHDFDPEFKHMNFHVTTGTHVFENRHFPLSECAECGGLPMSLDQVVDRLVQAVLLHNKLYNQQQDRNDSFASQEIFRTISSNQKLMDAIHNPQFKWDIVMESVEHPYFNIGGRGNPFRLMRMRNPPDMAPSGIYTEVMAAIPEYRKFSVLLDGIDRDEWYLPVGKEYLMDFLKEGPVYVHAGGGVATHAVFEGEVYRVDVLPNAGYTPHEPYYSDDFTTPTFEDVGYEHIRKTYYSEKFEQTYSLLNKWRKLNWTWTSRVWLWLSAVFDWDTDTTLAAFDYSSIIVDTVLLSVILYALYKIYTIMTRDNECKLDKCIVKWFFCHTQRCGYNSPCKLMCRTHWKAVIDAASNHEEAPLCTGYHCRHAQRCKKSQHIKCLFNPTARRVDLNMDDTDNEEEMVDAQVIDITQLAQELGASDLIAKHTEDDREKIECVYVDDKNKKDRTPEDSGKSGSRRKKDPVFKSEDSGKSGSRRKKDPVFKSESAYDNGVKPVKKTMEAVLKTSLIPPVMSDSEPNITPEHVDNINEACVDAGALAQLNSILDSKFVKINVDYKNGKIGSGYYHGLAYKNYVISPAHGTKMGQIDTVTFYQNKRYPCKSVESDGNPSVYKFICCYVNSSWDMAILKPLKPLENENVFTKKVFESSSKLLPLIPNEADYFYVSKTQNGVMFIPNYAIVQSVHFNYVKKVTVSSEDRWGAYQVIGLSGRSGEALTTPGDCGAPLVVFNANASPKLVGFHTVGVATGQKTYSMALTQERMAKAIMCADKYFSDKVGRNYIDSISKLELVDAYLYPNAVESIVYGVSSGKNCKLGSKGFAALMMNSERYDYDVRAIVKSAAELNYKFVELKTIYGCSDYVIIWKISNWDKANCEDIYNSVSCMIENMGLKSFSTYLLGSGLEFNKDSDCMRNIQKLHLVHDVNIKLYIPTYKTKLQCFYGDGMNMGFNDVMSRQTSDKYDNIIDLIDQTDQAEGNFIGPGEFKFIGQADFSAKPASRRSGEFVKAPFYGCYDLKKVPSVLSVEDPRVKDISHLLNDDFGFPNMVVTETTGYGDVDHVIDQNIMDTMVKQLVDYCVGVFGNCEMDTPVDDKVLVSESINGNPEIEFYEPINFKASNGLPYSLLGNAKGNSMFKLNDQTNKFEFRTDSSSRYCKKRLQMKFKYAKTGIKILSLWKNCLKSELRPIAKVEKPKTRVFTAAPRESTLLFRMLFGRYKAFFCQFRNDLFHAVGINPMSMEWKELYDSLNIHPNVIDIDFSAYDKRETRQFMEAAGTVVIETIDRVTDDGNQLKLARYVAWDELIRTPMVSYDSVYLKLHGNCSGNPLTTVLNCWVNFLYHWYVFISVTGNVIDLSKFMEHVQFYSFGDDVIQSISDVMYPKYNFSTIKETLGKIGQVVTTGSKDLLGGKTNILEATFLQRHFREVDSLVLAPLNRDSIESLFSYSSIPVNASDDWKTTIYEQLIEVAVHGSKYFDQFTSKLRTFIRQSDFRRSYPEIFQDLNVMLTKPFASWLMMIKVRLGVVGLDKNETKFLKFTNNPEDSRCSSSRKPRVILPSDPYDITMCLSARIRVNEMCQLNKWNPPKEVSRRLIDKLWHLVYDFESECFQSAAYTIADAKELAYQQILDKLFKDDEERFQLQNQVATGVSVSDPVTVGISPEAAFSKADYSCDGGVEIQRIKTVNGMRNVVCWPGSQPASSAEAVKMFKDVIEFPDILNHMHYLNTFSIVDSGTTAGDVIPSEHFKFKYFSKMFNLMRTEVILRMNVKAPFGFAAKFKVAVIPAGTTSLDYPGFIWDLGKMNEVYVKIPWRRVAMWEYVDQPIARFALTPLGTFTSSADVALPLKISTEMQLYDCYLALPVSVTSLLNKKDQFIDEENHVYTSDEATFQIGDDSAGQQEDVHAPPALASKGKEGQAGLVVGSSKVDVGASQTFSRLRQVPLIPTFAGLVFKNTVGNWTIDGIAGKPSHAMVEACRHYYVAPTDGKFTTFKITTSATAQQNGRLIIAQIPPTILAAEVAAYSVSDLSQFPHREHCLHGGETLFETSWMLPNPVATQNAIYSYIVIKVMEMTSSTTVTDPQMSLWIDSSNVSFSVPVPFVIPAIVP